MQLLKVGFRILFVFIALTTFVSCRDEPDSKIKAKELKKVLPKMDQSLKIN